MEVTASLGIASLPCFYGWPTALGISFGMIEETASGSVALSPYMILLSQGQGSPRQYILAVWILFIHSRTFLPPRHGPWARYEMGRGPQILWPHRTQ